MSILTEAADLFCSKCGTWKSRTAFYVRQNGRHRTPCKTCYDQRSRAWEEKARAHWTTSHKKKTRDTRYRENNRTRLSAKQRKFYASQSKSILTKQHLYRSRNPDVIKNQNLRRVGWTLEEFRHAWAKQSGKCAICERQMIQGGRSSNSVAADHSHQTGKRRGLLCFRCNALLGHYERFGDRISSYLKTEF
jgi:hypothetical protein